MDPNTSLESNSEYGGSAGRHRGRIRGRLQRRPRGSRSASAPGVDGRRRHIRMTSHVGDEIPGLLCGDALRPAALTAIAHLRVCPDCRDELISALLGHVALTSAARLLRQTEPVTEKAAADRESAGSVGRFPFDRSGAQPRTSLEPSRTSLVADKAAGRARDRRRRRVGLAAAAAVLATAGAAGVLLPHGSAARAVSLSAYGVGTTNASAEFVGSSDVDIRANLPALSGGNYYEVWLTDAARTVMTPVGQLASAGSTQLSLSRDVASRFGDIEISLQSSTDGSAYSGVSVLRGQYKPS
jgi:hypothetical protein